MNVTSSKFVNNSKTRIQNIHSNLANIIEATALVPENDRIYPDCPHATAIIIIASYVDDNLAFTNCTTLAKEFEGGLSMWVCKLDGDNALFDWYGNCKGDFNTIARLVR